MTTLSSSILVMRALLFFLLLISMLAVFADTGLCASAQESLVELEIRYQLAAAGEVLFVWGVNGWLPVSEDIRPLGTVMRKQVMSTPMALKEEWFTVTIRAERGTKVDYGFLVTKTAGGAFVEVWDGDDS